LTLSGVAKDDKSIIAAKNYLKSLQSETGGIKYDSSSWTTSSDAFSDAYAVEAIYALGEDPNDAFWQKDGKTILDDLAGLRNEDGSYSFSSDYGKMNPVWTTSIVLVALNKKPLAFKGENLKNFYQSAISPTPQPSLTFTSSPTPTVMPSFPSTPEALVQPIQSLTPQPQEKEKNSSYKAIPSAVLVKSQTVQAQAQDNSQPDVKGEQNQREAKFNWFWLPLICLSSFSAGVGAKWLELKLLKAK